MAVTSTILYVSDWVWSILLSLLLIHEEYDQWWKVHCSITTFFKAITQLCICRLFQSKAKGAEKFSFSLPLSISNISMKLYSGCKANSRLIKLTILYIDIVKWIYVPLPKIFLFFPPLRKFQEWSFWREVPQTLTLQNQWKFWSWWIEAKKCYQSSDPVIQETGRQLVSHSIILSSSKTKLISV